MKKVSVVGADRSVNSEQVQTYQSLELAIQKEISILEEVIAARRAPIAKYKALFCTAAKTFDYQLQMFFLTPQDPNDPTVNEIIRDKDTIAQHIANMYSNATRGDYNIPTVYEALLSDMNYLQRLFPNINFISFYEHIQQENQAFYQQHIYPTGYSATYSAAAYSYEYKPTEYGEYYSYAPLYPMPVMHPGYQMPKEYPMQFVYDNSGVSSYPPEVQQCQSQTDYLVDQQSTTLEPAIAEEQALEETAAPLQSEEENEDHAGLITDKKHEFPKATEEEDELPLPKENEKQEEEMVLRKTGFVKEEDLLPKPPASSQSTTTEKKKKNKKKKSQAKQQPEAEQVKPKLIDPIDESLQTYDYISWNEQLVARTSLTPELVRTKVLGMCKGVPGDEPDTLQAAAEFVLRADITISVLIDILVEPNIAFNLKETALQRLLNSELNLELYLAFNKHRKSTKKRPGLHEILRSNAPQFASEENAYEEKLEQKYLSLDAWGEQQLERLVRKYTEKGQIVSDDTEIALALCNYKSDQVQYTLLMRLLQTRISNPIFENSRLIILLIKNSDLSIRDPEGRTVIHHMLALSGNANDSKYTEFFNCMMQVITKLSLNIQPHCLLPDYNGNTFLHTLVKHAETDHICAESLDVIKSELQHFYAQTTAFVNKEQETVFHMLDKKNICYKVSVKILYDWLLQAGKNRNLSRALSQINFVSNVDPVLHYIETGKYERILEIIEQRAPHVKGFQDGKISKDFRRTFLVESEVFAGGKIGDEFAYRVLVNGLCAEGNEAIAERFQKSRAFKDLEARLLRQEILPSPITINDTLAYRMTKRVAESAGTMMRRDFDVYVNSVAYSINKKDVKGVFPIQRIWKIGDKITPWLKYCIEILKVKLCTEENTGVPLFSCNLAYITELVVGGFLSKSVEVDLAVAAIKGGDRVYSLQLRKECEVTNPLFAAVYRPNLAFLRALLETHSYTGAQLDELLLDKNLHDGYYYSLLEFVYFKLTEAISERKDHSMADGHKEDQTIDELQKMYHYVRTLFVKRKITASAAGKPSLASTKSKQVIKEVRKEELPVSETRELSEFQQTLSRPLSTVKGDSLPEFLDDLRMSVEAFNIDLWNIAIAGCCAFPDTEKHITTVLTTCAAKINYRDPDACALMCYFLLKAFIPAKVKVGFIRECRSFDFKLSVFRNLLENSTIDTLYIANGGRKLMQLLRENIFTTPEICKEHSESYGIIAKLCITMDLKITKWENEKIVGIISYIETDSKVLDAAAVEYLYNYQRPGDGKTLLMICIEALGPHNLIKLSLLLTTLLKASNLSLRDSDGRTALHYLLSKYNPNYFVFVASIVKRIAHSKPKAIVACLKADSHGNTVLHTLAKNLPSDVDDLQIAELLNFIFANLNAYAQEMLFKANNDFRMPVHLLEEYANPLELTHDEIFRACSTCLEAKRVLGVIQDTGIMTYLREPLLVAIENADYAKVLRILENRYVVRYVVASHTLKNEQDVKALLKTYSQDLVSSTIHDMSAHEYLVDKLMQPGNEAIAHEFMKANCFLFYEHLVPGCNTLTLNAVLFLASMCARNNDMSGWLQHPYAPAVENLQRLVQGDTVHYKSPLTYAYELGSSSVDDFLRKQIDATKVVSDSLRNGSPNYIM